MTLYTLGVFAELYGSNDSITIPQALVIALLGFCITVLMLSLLAIFVKGFGAIFDGIGKRSARKAAVAQSAGESGAPVQTLAADEPFNPLPPNKSNGQLKLTNVTEDEAAIIMAVVSHESGIPLNHLQFDSIRLLEDEEK